MRCAGVLLTGGASSRFGRDKATAPWGDATLAERAAGILAAVTSPTLEIGPGVSGLTHVDDPRQGPLVALATALPHLPSGFPVLVLACDLPLVDDLLLRWLADHPSPGSVVPLAGDPPRPQPLTARWSPATTSRIPALVAAGEHSLRPLLTSPDVLLVPLEEWADPSALDDTDTPADLERLRAIDQRRRRAIG
jgi:molybdopterin-guanine dinucleotide biosynthesis protein A